MFLNVLLLLVIIIPSFIIAYLITRGQNKYWLIGISCLTMVILTGLNSLILSFLGLLISQQNLLLLFGVECAVSLALFFYVILRSRKEHTGYGWIKLKEIYRNETLIILIFLSFCIVSLLFVLDNQDRNGYTEFYFQETQYDSSTWRRNHKYSEFIDLNLVVVNHELKSTEYHVVVYDKRSTVTQADFGRLDPGESVTKSLELSPLSDPNTRYDFFLYKNDSTSPYRLLSLWIRRHGD